MEVTSLLEQHIERLCASQICDNHNKFLQLLAAFGVAVTAVQTLQSPPYCMSVSLVTLLELQKRPPRMTSAVPMLDSTTPPKTILYWIRSRTFISNNMVVFGGRLI